MNKQPSTTTYIDKDVNIHIDIDINIAILKHIKPLRLTVIARRMADLTNAIVPDKSNFTLWLVDVVQVSPKTI